MSQEDTKKPRTLQEEQQQLTVTYLQLFILQ